MSTTLLHQLRDLWRSPRGTVLRIEALALVAIALSFFLAVFGSCRRWSNHWIIQKGVLAANALSWSLGTYCIGLMQSSSVKSEMYPIWGVSLLTLFVCIDSITAYNLEYKSQLWKMLYLLCLYCGYVLLIGISTISSCVGNIAVFLLSVITFIKGFHKSLALVLPIKLRRNTRRIAQYMEGFRHDLDYVVQWRYFSTTKRENGVTQVEPITVDEIWKCKDRDVGACKDVCLSFALSHLLQRHLFGLECAESEKQITHDFVFKRLLQEKDGILDYKRAFKVIEVELSFLYDAFFTSKAFLRYYQAGAASIWAFASVIGICFVGVVAFNPGMRASNTSDGAIIVDTTPADLAITIVILASLALLQVLQLLRCWTSNWARVAFVCDYIWTLRPKINGVSPDSRVGVPEERTLWMILKAHLTRINCFNNYLWQNKLGQYSFVESLSMTKRKLFRSSMGYLSKMFGFNFIGQVLWEVWGRETGYAIELHSDVKIAISEFLHRNGHFRRTDSSTLLDENGLGWSELPTILGTWGSVKRTRNVLAWHIGTCYCELAQCKKGSLNEEERKYHGIATALSKYYAYLVVSAPHLVCKGLEDAKAYCNEVIEKAMIVLHGKKDKLEAMRWLGKVEKLTPQVGIFRAGVELGKMLEPMSQRWKVLADFWVEALIYAAPSDNVEEHIRHLSHGGEFITHLWALLSHAGILKRPAEELE